MLLDVFKLKLKTDYKIKMALTIQNFVIIGNINEFIRVKLKKKL